MKTETRPSRSTLMPCAIGTQVISSAGIRHSSAAIRLGAAGRFLRDGRRTGGFALVVTLSLMILLTIIAVGLLTLSSISLRAASQGDAMARAKANAHLGLMMAIGDLQKSLGPDRAVSATSGIRSENPGKPNLTGVWESWDYDPAGAPNYDSQKSSNFQRWLVSSPNTSDVESPGFVDNAWSGETIELIGDGALGANAPADAMVKAGLITVDTDDKSKGAYAWHVSGESVKARVNAYRDPEHNNSLWRRRALLAGHRPNAAVIEGFDNKVLDFLPTDEDVAAYDEADEMSHKLIDAEQFSLLKDSGLRPFRHEVTPYSLGVLADVRKGGLKQDLSTLLADKNSLPSEYSGTNGRVYASTHGITGTSDPYWSALAGYYNTYQDFENANDNPTVSASLAKDVDFGTLDVPQEYRVAPLVSKVELLLTYVTRNSTWSSPYMAFLVFTPIVTLHNPYNVNLSFERIKVTLGTVPVGIRFKVNGNLKHADFSPVNMMYIPDSGTRDVETKYIMEIANWPSYSAPRPRGAIVMKPGESMVCSPYLDPDTTWGKGADIDNRGNNLGKQQKELKAKPGFFGRCFGFNVDVVAPDPRNPNDNTGNGVILLQGDQGQVEERMAIQHQFLEQKTGVTGEFQVHTELYVNGGWKSYGGLRYKFGSRRSLWKLVGTNLYEYPEFGVMDAYVPNGEPIKDHARAITFGVFSAYARTASGGVNQKGERTVPGNGNGLFRDGLLGGKPFVHHNPAVPVVSHDLNLNKLGSSSHEVNLQPFVSSGDAEDNYLTIDSEGRTPTATGNSVTRGIKSASLFELPSGPMQAIADFRRSNAFTSSFLPGFVQPVSNSTVSPLMNTDKVVESNSSIADYQLLDHSVLANHALYDSFYFSSIADYDNMDAESVFEEFLKGETKLASQAFEPYLPAGRSVEEARDELFGGNAQQAHRNVAEYQMVKGPFNVNSTSVQAWKAMLSSLAGNEILTLWARDGSVEDPPRRSENVPILGMTLHNGGLVGGTVDSGKIDNDRTNDWNGYRELSETEIQTLAEEIVKEVRERGPFLSMSEFVNRRVGSNSESTRAGALEAAISESGINDSFGANYLVPIEADDVSDAKLYNYPTPEVVSGNPAEGAPGWICQGDLLKILEPRATVRSDTFVIRVAGQALDSSGKVVASAYAEAVVQRVPEYLDPADRPSAIVTDGSGDSTVNENFGRRMSIVSFRWLSPGEV